MEHQAAGAADGAQIVVRNTFIDAVEEEEEDGGPDRTMSDQTGLRSKRVLQLGRLSARIKPITEERASVAAETQPGGPEEDDADDCLDEGDEGEEEDAEDDDEDSDMPLTRTQSVAYPASGAMASSAVDLKDATLSLQRYAATQADGEGGVGEEDASYADYMHSGMLPWGFAAPYGMFDGYSMFPPPWVHAGTGIQGPLAASSKDSAGADGKDDPDGQEDSAPSDWHSSAAPPALGVGPPLGMLHAFHPETREMGLVSPDFRQFSKVGYEGRLSVVSEREVHTDGLQRYLVQFTAGELSRADGVGFVFSPRLPCAKNIQRIVSIFVNQRGRICMRVFADIVRASAYVKPLELGDWVEMAIDLEERVATFNIWPRTASGWPELMGRPSSTAVFPYGQRLGKLNQDPGKDGKKSKGAPQANHKSVKLNVGHLACVVKNVGVTVTLAS